MASESVSIPAVTEPWFPNQFHDPATDMYDGSVWMTNDLSSPSSYTLIADNGTQALRDVFDQHNRHPEQHLTLTKLRAASNKLLYLSVISFETVSGMNQYGYLRSVNGGNSWEWLVFKEEDELVYPDINRCPTNKLEDDHLGYKNAAWDIATSKLEPDSDDPSKVKSIMVDHGQMYISDNGGYSWR
jgi:hypothetical protein